MALALLLGVIFTTHVATSGMIKIRNGRASASDATDHLGTFCPEGKKASVYILALLADL